MVLTSGTRLGPYEVAGQIGVGGMGEVYRATDTNLKRAVAIKVLPASVAGDAERLARFQREAEVLASLNHPNIAAIYGLERSGGITGLVMELVEGPTLADRIAQGSIPIDEVLPIAKQIAEALEAAHEQGIIHRDLKPANIKVRPDGTVKVLDFGLAKAMEPPSVTSVNVSQARTITTPAMMTGVGMILGTAAYMSPEQARGKPVDRRTDIWAFGCVLYEMLTGRQAFRGETVADAIASVLNRDPDLSLLSADVTVRMKELLRRSLDKDPRRRWQAIGDLRWELDAAAAEPATLPAERGHREIHSRLRPTNLVIAAAVSVVIAGGSLVLLRPPAPSVEMPSVRLTVQPNQVLGNPGVSEMALSPDGRHLVFTDSGPAGKALWVRVLGTGDVRLLPGTEDAWYPFWSPDSRFVGFWADGALKKVPVLGGPVQTISEARSAGGAAWGEAGTIVFGTNRGLFQVPAGGGIPAALTTVDQVQSDVSHVFPQFLPDGNQVLYFVSADRPERRGVYVRTLGSSDAKRVLETDSPAVFVEPGYVLTVRDQVLLAYPFDADTMEVSGEPVAIADGVGRGMAPFYPSISASANRILAYGSALGIGLIQPVWSDRKGRRLGTVGSPESVVQVRLSPDGTRAALLKRDPKTNLNNIWISELSTQVSALFATDSGDPIWSPDGRRLAFNARRDGPQLLYDKPIGGGDERLLLKSRGNLEDWTRDGQSIVFRDSGATFLLPLSGNRTPQELFAAEPSTSRNQFHLSPDGQWIAYTSDESGTPDVWVASFPMFTDRRQVSKGGGDVPRWRNDQREMYYLAPDGGMMSVDLTIGTTIQTGAPTRLFDTRILASGGFDRYDVTGDGQRFLLLESPASSAVPPITVITNWTSLLR